MSCSHSSIVKYKIIGATGVRKLIKGIKLLLIAAVLPSDGILHSSFNNVNLSPANILDILPTQEGGGGGGGIFISLNVASLEWVYRGTSTLVSIQHLVWPNYCIYM